MGCDSDDTTATMPVHDHRGHGMWRFERQVGKTMISAGLLEQKHCHNQTPWYGSDKAVLNYERQREFSGKTTAVKQGNPSLTVGQRCHHVGCDGGDDDEELKILKLIRSREDG